MPEEISGLFSTCFTIHVVVCPVPRASKMLTNQQMFLAGGWWGGGVVVKSKHGINMYRQEHCSLSTEDLMPSLAVRLAGELRLLLGT